MEVDIVAWDDETANAVRNRMEVIRKKDREERVYTWRSDAGHAWLRVPLRELKELGICDKVSEYSYIGIDGGTSCVFLEEDADAGIFLDAVRTRDNVAHSEQAIKYIEVYDGDQSQIRSYKQFIGENYK